MQIKQSLSSSRVARADCLREDEAVSGNSHLAAGSSALTRVSQAAMSLGTRSGMVGRVRGRRVDDVSGCSTGLFVQGKASDQLGQLRKCSVVRRVSGFAKWASNRVRTLSSVSGLVRASGVVSGGPNPNTHPNNKAPTHTPNRTPKYQSKTLVALHRHKTETPKPSTQTPHGTQRYLTQTLDTRRIVDTWRNTQTIDHPPRATPTCETHSWSA